MAILPASQHSHLSKLSTCRLFPGNTWLILHGSIHMAHFTRLISGMCTLPDRAGGVLAMPASPFFSWTVPLASVSELPNSLPTCAYNSTLFEAERNQGVAQKHATRQQPLYRMRQRLQRSGTIYARCQQHRPRSRK